MSNVDNSEIQQYRNNMTSIVDYIRKRRAFIRSKTLFNPPQDFIDLENINKGDFALSPEKLEFFYPASKNHVNWGYHKDHMASVAKADKKFLQENFPVKTPDLDTYFEEREKIALFDKNFPLRFPPLYYLSKSILSIIFFRYF